MEMTKQVRGFRDVSQRIQTIRTLIDGFVSPFHRKQYKLNFKCRILLYDVNYISSFSKSNLCSQYQNTTILNTFDIQLRSVLFKSVLVNK
jgi:hypothetical protein